MKKILWAVVVVVIVAAGWYYLSRSNESAEYANTSTSPTPTEDAMMHGDISAKVDVTLTDSGFTPNTITIKQGQTVVWTNQSASPMWVASAVHPSHTAYDGTALQEHCSATTEATPFDECARGDSYTFTFDKVGTWQYHNHANPTQTGTVIVTQ